MDGIETTEEFERAQAAARELEAVADYMPGWMVDESGLRKVIDRLYEVEDPQEK